MLLRNSGMLIRHFMLAHLKVCRPFVMRGELLVKKLVHIAMMVIDTHIADG